MQPQTATEATVPIGQARYHRRLTKRYGGDAAKARAVKAEVVKLRALFPGNRARMFSDRIQAAAEMRVLANDARAQAITSPPRSGYDYWASVWRLETEARKAEAECHRLAVPDVLTAAGGDPETAAVLAAAGLWPSEGASRDGSSEPAGPTQGRTDDPPLRTGGDNVRAAGFSEAVHGGPHVLNNAEPGDVAASDRDLPPTEWSLRASGGR